MFLTRHRDESGACRVPERWHLAELGVKLRAMHDGLTIHWDGDLLDSRAGFRGMVDRIRQKDWKTARWLAGALWHVLGDPHHSWHGRYELALRSLRAIENTLRIDNESYWFVFRSGSKRFMVSRSRAAI